jgi:hypothetical protein
MAVAVPAADETTAEAVLVDVADKKEELPAAEPTTPAPPAALERLRRLPDPVPPRLPCPPRWLLCVVVAAVVIVAAIASDSMAQRLGGRLCLFENDVVVVLVAVVVAVVVDVGSFTDEEEPSATVTTAGPVTAGAATAESCWSSKAAVVPVAPVGA